MVIKMNKEKIVDELIKLSNKSAKKKEVPVSAIVIKNGKIISKSYNKRQKSHNILDHAEIIAINKAQKKLKDWRLDDCVLYVTLEPCKMCKTIITQSRIKEVYYLQKTKFDVQEDTVSYIELDTDDRYEKILKNFFKTLRKK